MNATSQIAPALWIKDPKTDLIFFSFGWILLFGCFVAVDQMGVRGIGMGVLLTIILMTNFVHRHLTFPLVYADPAQFNARKKAYILLPLLCLVVTLATLFFFRKFFIALVFFSVAWTIYHTIMQKMGILRIYSRKAGYGSSRLDRALIFLWFVYLFFQLAALPHIRDRAARLTSTGRVLKSFLDPLMDYLPFLAGASLVVAIVVTVYYLKIEFDNRHQFHWPKNLFLGSVLMLYATFSYDLVVGYAVFGFSHAVEYLAFVYVYAGKKYSQPQIPDSPMARWVRHKALAMGIFIVTMMVAFISWRSWSGFSLSWYIVGSSFLHFIYDGWIWKVRDPKVGKPLGIDYSRTPQVQTA